MLNYIRKKILSNKKLRKKIIRTIRKQQLNTFKISNFPIYDYFKNDSGETVSLHKNLRSFVTPNWEKKFIQQVVNGKVVNSMFDFDLDLARIEYQLFFNYLDKTLMTFNTNLNHKKVLEIGCGNALLSHLVKEKYPQSQIVASDIDSYYDHLDKGTDIIHARDKVKNAFDFSIDYETDNITKSKFEDNSFDYIISFTVLEHIDNIEEAFKEMNRILKPEGLCFHIYNPFFSYNGAHAVCSNDHPWGHCVLTSKEYDRFIDEIYPQYSKISKSFYQNDLNKKSLSEFKKAMDESGFSVSTLIPETNLNVMQLLLPNTLEMTIRNYPNADLTDLLTNSAIVILKK
jgi:ubiquinone/menaquinone biosynthesis C-methylase UbiE